MKNTCKNHDCGMVYDIENEEEDLGYCSFECWEKDNCHDPVEVPFPELALD